MNNTLIEELGINRFAVICGSLFRAIFPVKGALVSSEEYLNEELILKSRKLNCVVCGLLF
jgi:hypothetical protein